MRLQILNLIQSRNILNLAYIYVSIYEICIIFHPCPLLICFLDLQGRLLQCLESGRIEDHKILVYKLEYPLKKKPHVINLAPSKQWMKKLNIKKRKTSYFICLSLSLEDALETHHSTSFFMSNSSFASTNKI